MGSGDAFDGAFDHVGAGTVVVAGTHQKRQDHDGRTAGNDAEVGVLQPFYHEGVCLVHALAEEDA